MSLTDKKNALFGSAPMSSVPAEKKTAPKAAKVCNVRIETLSFLHHHLYSPQ
jgi:hypothetical protein